MTDIILLFALPVLFALLLSLLVFQALTGVPPMPAGSAGIAEVIALLKQAELAPRAVIYELGSGWGTLAIALAKAFPEAQIRGIELSPLPYWIARLRTRSMPNVSLRRVNFYHADLRDADAVTCYLMTKPMPKLANLLDIMLKPGTPVVSLTFWFRGRKAEVPSTVHRGEAALYYWSS